MFDITLDTSELDAHIEQFRWVAQELPAAVSRALNRAGDAATTAIGRELAAETGAHVHDVRDGMEQYPSSPDDLIYTISVSGEFMPLSEFDPHQTQRGISARPWGERRLFPSTFEIPAAPDHVFARVGAERLPIRELWGPSLAREAERGVVEQVARDTVQEVFPRRLAHEVSRLLGNKSGGGDE
jgi:hypothetical protein